MSEKEKKEDKQAILSDKEERDSAINVTKAGKPQAKYRLAGPDRDFRSRPDWTVKQSPKKFRTGLYRKTVPKKISVRTVTVST